MHKIKNEKKPFNGITKNKKKTMQTHDIDSDRNFLVECEILNMVYGFFYFFFF